jgi:hypothetical protein
VGRTNVGLKSEKSSATSTVNTMVSFADPRSLSARAEPPVAMAVIAPSATIATVRVIRRRAVRTATE